VYAVSFWGGFQIMALEICGFRVLQTNVGSSVVVTGALLTLVMLSLSIGYTLGGVLSARLKSPRGLFALFLGAAAYTEIVTALFFEPIVTFGFSLKATLPPDTLLRSILPALFVSAALYGIPMLILSMTTPYLIRFFSGSGSERSGDPGFRSGFFMSLSTLGSIAGTLVASYVLIPMLGVERTTTATNAIFFVLAAASWIASAPVSTRLVPRLGVIGALGAALLLAFGIHSGKPARDPSIVYEAESHYGQIRVVRRLDDANRSMLVYHPSRFYTHSLVYPGEPLRDLPELMYLAPTRFEPSKDVLVLGSAAGGILRRIEAAFPDARVVGVDLDPLVHEVAREVFEVNTEQSSLVTADARVFLKEDQRRYDLIIVDLFAGEFIPSHCISVEFFKLVHEHLNPRGGVFLNTNMQDIHHDLPEGTEPFRTPRHLESTLRAAGFPSLFENSFFHSFFAFPFELSAAQLRGELIATFHDPERLAPLRAAAGLAAYTTASVPSAGREYRPFTDRWSPSLMVELRTNAVAVYDALEQAGSTPAEKGGAAAVLDAVLRARWAERKRSGQPSLRDEGALLRLLNEVEGQVSAEAVDIGAAYFRYPYYREMLKSDTVASSPWARWASLYARMYALGYRNEYEALLPVLEEAAEFLAPAAG
jgi:spermidine synthase